MKKCEGETENGESYKRVQTQVETYEKWRETDQRENGVLSRLVRVLSSATCPALSRQTPSQNFPAAATLNTLFSGKQTNKQICFQL